MTSYRTLLFGTIAVLAAAAPVAPAYADSAAAVPSPVRTTMDSAAAVPSPVHSAIVTGGAASKPTPATHPSFAGGLIDALVRFEEMVLRITL